MSVDWNFVFEKLIIVMNEDSLCYKQIDNLEVDIS